MHLVALRVLQHVTHVTQVASVAERRIIKGLMLRQGWSSDPNAVFDARSTFGERVSDQVARFGGSWTFITIS